MSIRPKDQAAAGASFNVHFHVGIERLAEPENIGFFARTGGDFVTTLRHEGVGIQCLQTSQALLDGSRNGPVRK